MYYCADYQKVIATMMDVVESDQQPAIGTLLHFVSGQRPSDTPITDASGVVVTSTGMLRCTNTL